MTRRRAAARRRLRVTVTDRAGRRVPDAGLARWLERVAPAAARGTVSIALVQNRAMRALNRTYRGQDKPTDVLSFPAENDLGSRFLKDDARSFPKNDSRGHLPQRTQHLGDLAIALGVARAQARDHGHSLATELRVLALHGLLHLLGYDHEVDDGTMRRVEDRLRRRGGLASGLTSRVSRTSTRR